MISVLLYSHYYSTQLSCGLNTGKPFQAMGFFMYAEQLMFIMECMRELSYNLFRNSELLILLMECIAAFVLLWFAFRLMPEWKKSRRQGRISSLDFVKPSVPEPSLTKKDWRSMCIITAMYAIVSFHMLGSTSYVNTTWQPADESTDIILECEDETSFDAVYAIYNEGDNNSNPDAYQLGFHNINVYGSSDRKNWQKLCTMEGKGIYQYKIYEGDWNYRYVWIASRDKNDTITEFALRKSDHSGFLNLKVISESDPSDTYPASLIIDEQDKVPLVPTYYEQSYFDEVYHARNAWEIANGQRMYATVHPLFGTNLMALAIRVLGFTPFGWRFAGALTGVLMVPLLYVLCKLLFHKTFACTCGAVLLAAEFMHITTSRIGTLEPFSVFFIMWMFYYMIRYYLSSFYDTPLKRQLQILLICGILMGIAIATKWTGCYSAVGLAVLLFANLIRRWREYVKAGQVLKDPAKHTLNQIRESEHIRKVFVKNLIITLACCVVFFIIIPLIIYVLTYLPDHVWKDDTWSLANVWKQTRYIFTYHKNVDATHPYQSVWYMWLLDIRPIWYHISTDGNGYVHSISCFSNPLLCYGGLFGIATSLIHLILDKDQKAMVIVTGYVSALCPWLLVERCVFSYHFYPTSIFTILAIVYLIDQIMRNAPEYKKWIIAFMAVYVFLFVVFLPVTCGFGTSLNYINSLEWLGTWHFG